MSDLMFGLAAVAYLLCGSVVLGVGARSLKGQPVTAFFVILFWPFILAMAVGIAMAPKEDTTTHSAKEEK